MATSGVVHSIRKDHVIDSQAVDLSQAARRWASGERREREREESGEEKKKESKAEYTVMNSPL